MARLTNPLSVMFRVHRFHRMPDPFPTHHNPQTIHKAKLNTIGDVSKELVNLLVVVVTALIRPKGGKSSALTRQRSTETYGI